MTLSCRCAHSADARCPGRYFSLLPLACRLEMAKSKNHTAHNQTRKNHRNGMSPLCDGERADGPLGASDAASSPGAPHPLSRPFLAGIKQPKPQKYGSNKGVDPKFIKNQKFVKRGNLATEQARKGITA
jgi:large subunit ribosomal protein L29e